MLKYLFRGVVILVAVVAAVGFFYRDRVASFWP